MGERLRIVVADDDDLVRECLRHWLADLGHDVTAVDGGEPLVGVCCASRPDLVISDVSMPDLDGITAAGVIRRAAVPVILVSGGWDPETVERAAAAGVALCLPKPLRPPELVAAIEAVRPPRDDGRREAPAPTARSRPETPGAAPGQPAGDLPRRPDVVDVPVPGGRPGAFL